MSAIFFFHSGRQALMVPINREGEFAAYPVGILRQMGWVVNDVAMFRLPRFPEQR